MTPDETRDFAFRLMDEVWKPFDPKAVSRFYHPEMIGHHRAETLTLEDLTSRLQWDVLNFGDPVYEIKDVVAESDRFAIRFLYTCTMIETGATFVTEVIYFYALREGKIGEFWLLSDQPFEYKQRP